MRFLAVPLLAGSALAQFVGPATPASASSSAAAVSSSSSAAAAAFSSGTPTTSGIPPPPAGSTGCVLHIDHYHCDGPAASTSLPPGVAPAPTESTGCELHIDHWHCTGTADSHGSESHEEGSSSSSESGSGECIIHVGHTHGDCSAQDLACGAILMQDYNMGLHVGSVFMVLASSALGILIPMCSGWVRRSNGQRIASGDPVAFGRRAGFWASLFFLAKHFGTGIIISTAFIHLLFHGFVMFQNECVGELAYESTAAAISMAGALITFLFDYIGSRLAAKKTGHVHNHSHSGRASPARDGDAGSASGGSGNASPDREKSAAPFAAGAAGGHDCLHVDAAFASEEAWRVTLLEAGIIFHSIMIGVTLGASSGAGWTTLLIVIIFHQFFEGAALGARIALLYWISKVRASIMGLAFILITPIGIGIGIGVRQSFSQNGKASLLSVGILNAISAGILLYTAFKLLAHDFVDGPLKFAPIRTVLAAGAAIVVGLIGMSVLGKWA